MRLAANEYLGRSPKYTNLQLMKPESLAQRYDRALRQTNLRASSGKRTDNTRTSAQRKAPGKLFPDAMEVKVNK
jgi:hypothetical protein